jgi:diguanylate cyclase (GGDEF)-like protein
MTRVSTSGTDQRALEGRIRRLDCLYRLTRLLNEPGLSQDEVFQSSAESFPEAWQHSELAAARIAIADREYRSPGFIDSSWMQREEIAVSGIPIGRVEVCYQERPASRESALFLAEESLLLEAIAEHLGRYVERIQAHETLELNEARLNSLLRLFQLSTELNEQEILHYALEEAVKLTCSTIGYCHLVHDDQSSIELVTWSQHTLEICDAVYVTHYPISDAGVWADCARNRVPVMHNDYPNLVKKKGLPEGHADLTRHLSVPVVEDSKVSVIMGVGNKTAPYDESDVRQLQLLANDAWQIVRRKRVEHELQIMATTDSLTRLANRRHLFRRGAEEVRRVERYGGTLSTLLLDIDSFKKINDTHGHDVGDTVLRTLSDAVRASLRDIDIVGRIGGEEFAILLPNTLKEEARGLAERLAENIRRLSFSASGTTFGITASIGLAAYDTDMGSFDALLKTADIALYGAKRSGRDCVYG